MINKYIIEFKQLIKIGVPIFGSQMSYMLMGATDVVVAGRASANDLAGLALGTAFGNAIWFFISGVIFSVTPIIAQLYGAKKFIEIGKKLREILWIALFLSIFILTVELAGPFKSFPACCIDFKLTSTPSIDKISSPLYSSF